MEVKIFVCILFIFNSIHFCLAGFFWNCNRKRIFIALLSTTLSHCSSCPTHYSRAKRSSVRSIGRTCKESFEVQSCQVAAENLERAFLHLLQLERGFRTCSRSAHGVGRTSYFTWQQFSYLYQ